ncbi:hypothetical protein FRC08_001462 [Ceratobasidium sp. 394]|nr:hypothetical protein FRC08_001462 [Ceratobasidium sp. 394]
MVDSSLDPQTSSHVQPPPPPPAGQGPHIAIPPAPPAPSQVPLPNRSFEEQIAQHALTHQPFYAPSASPFVPPSIESVPSAPFVQWHPDPPPQPLHGQAVASQPAQPPKHHRNPPRADKFLVPAIKAPVPTRSREAEDDGEFGRARKRLRDDQFKPTSDPPPTAQASSRTTDNTVMFVHLSAWMRLLKSSQWAQTNAALAEATRQLAQPRDPVNGPSGGPAHATQQSNGGAADRDDLEGACQQERDEIMRNLYEGNIEDENGPGMVSQIVLQLEPAAEPRKTSDKCIASLKKYS